MSSILWVLISSFLGCLLTSKTKREEKFYKRREIQNIVKKYKISAEIIGSLFLIVLCALILLALYQSGGCVVIGIFLSSVYTLLLMSCVAIVVYVLCKINEHWNPDEILSCNCYPRKYVFQTIKTSTIFSFRNGFFRFYVFAYLFNIRYVIYIKKTYVICNLYIFKSMLLASYSMEKYRYS